MTNRTKFVLIAIPYLIGEGCNTEYGNECDDQHYDCNIDQFCNMGHQDQGYCKDKLTEGGWCDGPAYDYACAYSLDCVKIYHAADDVECSSDEASCQCSAGDVGSPCGLNSHCDDQLFCHDHQCKEQGTLQLSESCTWDTQCESGICSCVLTEGRRHRCVAPAEHKEYCCREKECNPDYTCLTYMDGWPICGLPNKQTRGEICWITRHCAEGLVCRPMRIYTEDNITYYDMKCNPPGPEGALCYHQSEPDICMEGLECIWVPDRETGNDEVCSAGKLGSPCGSHHDCKDDYICDENRYRCILQ